MRIWCERCSTSAQPFSFAQRRAPDRSSGGGPHHHHSSSPACLRDWRQYRSARSAPVILIWWTAAPPTCGTIRSSNRSSPTRWPKASATTARPASCRSITAWSSGEKSRKKHPWTVLNLLTAFEHANDIANRERFEHAEYHLATGLLAREAAQALRTPLVRHGIKANRMTLETAAQYSHEQGLTPRLVKLEEVFAASSMEQ